MRCPNCGKRNTQVKDSRPNEDGTMISRRRECAYCHSRFTTLEHIQMRELIVKKKNGSRMPFDREKLMRSIVLALRKRDVDFDKIEQLVNSTVHYFEKSGNSEILSSEIGRYVMQSLLSLDKVAYIRYASVYKNFKSTNDFEDFVKSLTMDKEKKRG